MLRVNASDGRTVYALTYALPAPFVFEDRLVRVADLDRDGWDEVFVVRSSPEEGARLAVYRIDVRNGKLQLTPTAAAPAIADAARQMECGADSLAHALAVQGEATTGSVRITTSQVAANYLLPEVLAALQAEEPGIAIELVASNQISNLLRREADIAVRMVRPAQATLVARKLADLPIVACAHASYLQRAGKPSQPTDLLQHRLIGFDRDDLLLRGFAALGLAVTRESFALRTDDQVAYGGLVAAGAGIGFVTAYNIRHWSGVVPLLPKLRIPPLPCWLAVHREIRRSRLVRRVCDYLAEAIPTELARATH